MNDIVFMLILLYIAVMSLVSVIITVYDKIAAKKAPKSRVPEATLLFVGVLGGACAMLLTMLMIRHKTKHAKFMVGLPVVILLQIACAVWAAGGFHVL